ncbi:hypothetical protein LG047_10465 [Methylocystis sp. WRRC1]|uniref:hypothetical protein n=1 Tax=unclassified Methylocystis TaxID=2625913 RepID=UPI0001F87565|nr:MULTISPECIES: hypothetical protein [unclassified Methylocystis]MCC3245745.1 hypothetical protein [Methylocystis sp. WRRC1]
MSLKLVFTAATLGLVLSAGSAFAYDRYYDSRQVWGDAVQEHHYNDAISASPSDVMRQRPRHVYRPAMSPHDPRGIIVLEGAQ